MPLKKKMMYTLRTIFKPIFMACGCCCGSTVPLSSHSHYIPGLPISPTVLRSPCPKIDESVAMAKESINPFEDYKNSMNQMIEERYIETEDDLKELLRCFLDINPPPQHNLIVRAFVDVCSHLQPPHDRRGKSLGRLLRLYVNNPLDSNGGDSDSHQISSWKRKD
ncbi:Transcription repressor OFP10 [Cardamine amara subsp. amara]|uniref:Transcription repressor n=1 Tax=Cardamine amara subsp. amara TaxID=228776 RepID=A0ABD0ZX72_CARAN